MKLIARLFLSLITLPLFSLTSYALEVNFENDPNSPVVYLNAAIKGGAVNDPRGQEGIVNFVGEMLLRGTQKKSKKDIDLALDQIGARLDAEIRTEALIFRGAVLASQLDPFLKLFTEILTQPSFPEDQISKLKSEIISGIQEQLGHDASLAALKFNQFLFPDHPYGRSIVGTTNSIQSINRKQLISMNSQIMASNSIWIIGSGDAPSEKITNWSNLLNQKLRGPSQTTLPSKPSPLKGKSLFIIDKPDRTQTQIHIGQLGVQMSDPNFFPLYIGNHAFGGNSFSAILMDEIRVKRGWSYGANSNFRHGTQPRSWMIHIYPAAKDAADALSRTLTLVNNLKNNGLTQTQFDFAKNSLINSAGFTYNTPRKRIENKLLEKTLDLPNGFVQSFATELGKVTLAQTNQALKDFLQPDKMTISVLATARTMKTALIKAAKVDPKNVQVVPFTQE